MKAAALLFLCLMLAASSSSASEPVAPGVRNITTNPYGAAFVSECHVITIRRGKVVHVFWDKVNDAIKYRVRERNDATGRLGKPVEVTDTVASIRFMTQGKFSIQVQSVSLDGVESNWASSIDRKAATVNGRPERWCFQVR